MNIIIIFGFLVVSLAVLQPASKCNLFTLLYNRYTATDRIIMGACFSMKFALTLLLITFIFIPILEAIGINSFLIYLCTGMVLIYSACELMKKRGTYVVNEKTKSPDSSFIIQAWRIPIFPSVSSFLMLLIFMFALKKIHHINGYNLATLDLIISILLGAIILSYDFSFNLLKQRGRIILRYLLSFFIFFAGVEYLVSGIVKLI